MTNIGRKANIFWYERMIGGWSANRLKPAFFLINLTALTKVAQWSWEPKNAILIP